MYARRQFNGQILLFAKVPVARKKQAMISVVTARCGMAGGRALVIGGRGGLYTSGGGGETSVGSRYDM